ncbi:MAG: TonB-dependent receptor plug domain-containing protein [Pacificimonas sp.]
MTNSLKTLLLFTALAMPVSSAVAQDDELPIAKRLPDVGVTAFSRERREERFLTEPEEIVRQVPNAVAVRQPGLGSGIDYTLRGLRDIPTFVNGIRFGSVTANHPGLFRFDRVDVGAGAFPVALSDPAAGGAVAFEFHRPGERTAGLFEGFYGEFDRKALRGSLDLPLGANGLAMTVDGYWQTTDGYVDNLTTDETLSQEDRRGGRLGLAVGDESFGWSAGVAFLRDETTNALGFDCDDPVDTDCDDRFATTGFGADPDDRLDPLEGISLAGGLDDDRVRLGFENEVDTVFVYSDGRFAVGDVTLRLLSGYSDADQVSGIDFADGRNTPTIAGMAAPVGVFRFGGNTRLAKDSTQQWSHDLSAAVDVGALAVRVGGVVYDRETTESVATLVTSDPGSGPVTILSSDQRRETGVEGVAAYAEADYTTPVFSVAAGFRYSDEEARLDLTEVTPGCQPTCTRLRPDDISYDEFTGHVTARAALSDGLALVGSVRKGMSSGGFDATGATYAPELSWTYEGGVEAGFFAGAVNARITGFYIDAKDVQAVDIFGRRAAAGADLTNYGVEAQLIVRPFAGITVEGAVGWQNAEYDESADAAAQQAACLSEIGIGGATPSCGAGLVRADGTLGDPVFTPDLTASGQVAYEFYLGDRAESFLIPSVGFSYRDEMQVTGADTLLIDTGDGGSADARVLVNAGLALRTDDDAWRVSVECDNCLDETYVDNAAFGYAYLGRPMTWTVRARRKF